MSILNEAANSAYGHVAYTPTFFYFYDQQCPEQKDTSHRSAFFVFLATSCHTFTLILGEGHISFVSVRGGGEGGKKSVSRLIVGKGSDNELFQKQFC